MREWRLSPSLQGARIRRTAHARGTHSARFGSASGAGGQGQGRGCRRRRGSLGSAGSRRPSQTQPPRGKRRAAIAWPLAVLCLAALGCGAGYAAWHTSRGGGSQAALDHAISDSSAPDPDSSAQARGAGDSGGGTGSPAGSGAPSPSGTGSSKDDAGASPAPKPSHVPKHGSGRFGTAHAAGPASGHGTVRRYKVEVESGIKLSASDAAHEIAGILADPRGWTNDGHDGFQLVSSGPPTS